jgi:hypothetical protein
MALAAIAATVSKRISEPRNQQNASATRTVAIALFQQRVSLGQLVRIPGREPMPDGLLADLLFRHWRDDFVVHQQAIYVQRLVLRGVGQLELDRLATFCIFDSGCQGRFEQFRFVLEFLHR